MNEYERLRRLAERHRETYPPGTRLELIDMNNPYAPVPSGTRGTAKFIDDMAQIHIELSEPLMELLLIQSAKQEIPVEDLVIRAIQNYMKRGENIAD